MPITLGTIDKSRMESMHEGRRLSDFILPFLPDRGDNMNEENKTSSFSIFVFLFNLVWHFQIMMFKSCVELIDFAFV